jgi:hypothetical protein
LQLSGFQNDAVSLTLWAIAAALAVAAILRSHWVLRLRHGAGRRQSVTGYLLVIILGAVVGATVFGAAWWWLERQSLEGVNSAQLIAERHQLRNRLGDLIQRGRLHQANMIAILQSRIPDEEKRVGPLVTAIGDYHMEVISFTEHNISHADAMRVSVPPPSVQYPSRIMTGIIYRDGVAIGGYDLRSSWDYLSGDLASLERFLTELPELKP